MVLPCCYHPITIYLLDDHYNFVLALSEALHQNDCYIKSEDAREALQYLNHEYKHHSILNFLLKQPSEDEQQDQLNYDIDIRNIHNYIYHPERFKEIPMVITDYAMPPMEGTHFLEQVTLPHIYKIMVTGEADDQIAIDAFNEHIIDKYIVKNSMALEKEIDVAIFELQYRYFQDISKQIINESVINKHPSLNVLGNKNFIAYFKNLIHQNQVLEYYLLDENGSYLLLDRFAKPSWLAVMDEESLLGYYDFAKNAENTPPAILTALEHKNKIPFFFSDADLQLPPHEWGPYLHPATLIEGDKTRYYVAYIKYRNTYKLSTNNLLSYDDYYESQADDYL